MFDHGLNRVSAIPTSQSPDRYPDELPLVSLALPPMIPGYRGGVVSSELEQLLEEGDGDTFLVAPTNPYMRAMGYGTVVRAQMPPEGSSGFVILEALDRVVFHGEASDPSARINAILPELNWNEISNDQAGWNLAFHHYESLLRASVGQDPEMEERVQATLESARNQSSLGMRLFMMSALLPEQGQVNVFAAPNAALMLATFNEEAFKAADLPGKPN